MTQTVLTTRTIAVYGALRSGTTVLRLMLDAHPQLSCPGETDFIFDHLISEQPPRYDMAGLEANRIYRAHEARYPDRPLPSPTPDAFLARIAGEGIGVPVLHRHLSKALNVYPDLRVVHLVRDPRDVARSSIGMGWAGTVYHGVGHWIETERDWEACQSRVAPEQSLSVHYEDLIAHPEETLSRICAFAGVTYDPQMLSYAGVSSYDKPDPSLTVQWKRKQTPQQVGLIEGRIGPLLQAAGYAPSGHPPVLPGALEQLRLGLENRRGIWRVRLKRYGLADPLILAASRRLGLTSLARRAQGRMDETALKYLK